MVGDRPCTEFMEQGDPNDAMEIVFIDGVHKVMPSLEQIRTRLQETK